MTHSLDEWEDPVPAKKSEWNGHRFDSLLEKSWAVTLDAYGFETTWHPGTVDLGVDGAWEPDVLVGDVMCEIKPHKGESVDRLWKPIKAHALHGLPVLVLRPGLVPDDFESEDAGCHWESVDGERWVAVFGDGAAHFRQAYADDVSGDYVRDSADVVMLDSSRVGLPMLHHSNEPKDDDEPETAETS